jgi:hypothetical protein
LSVIRTALACGALLLSGCATILGLEHNDGPSEDGGQLREASGAVDGSPIDARHADAGHVDAGHTDAGHGDAGHGDAGHTDAGHGDAGQDATVPPDATAPMDAHSSGPCDASSFCACAAADAQFCADFDEIGTFETQFPIDLVTPGGAISVSPAEAFSQPHSIVSQLSVDASTADAMTASFAFTKAGAAQQFNLRFEAFAGDCTFRNSGDVIASIAVSPSLAATVKLENNNGENALLAGAGNEDEGVPVAITENGWTAVTLSVDLAVGTETVSVAGTTQALSPQVFSGSPASSSVTVTLGQSGQVASNCAVYFDNVTFDTGP